MLGRFVLVLHSHLPYVLHHGRWPHGMEWLFEAASETYIPILNVLNDLVRDGYRPQMSISITPVLAEQLAHPDFAREFEEFLDEEIARCDDDAKLFRTSRTEKKLLPLARYWKSFYKKTRFDFTRTYRRDLIGAFRRLQDAGVLDILTCGATHGYFPLLGYDENIEAQIRIALATHERHFGVKPAGIWLPECAYRPRYEWTPPVDSQTGRQPRLRKGIEEILSAEGIRYFLVDSALVEGGRTIGMYLGRFERLRELMARLEQAPHLPGEAHSVYRPYYTQSSEQTVDPPVAIFARDVETSMQVWSSEQGYPGGEWYLDFHKKHHQSGHRYWRVTSVHADLGTKVSYEPSRTNAALDADVEHFVDAVTSALTKFRQNTGETGCLTAPFDSELFGHWWFEGPEFLKKLFIRLAQMDVRMEHCAKVLEEAPPQDTIAIPEGSWGAGGSHYVWLNNEVEWTWRIIYDCEAQMREAARLHRLGEDELADRIIRQMAREIWLLESSDWQFLVSTQSAIDYSTKRFREHHERFEQLKEWLTRVRDGGQLSEEQRQQLDRICREDDVFAENEIDVGWFVGEGVVAAV